MPEFLKKYIGCFLIFNIVCWKHFTIASTFIQVFHRISFSSCKSKCDVEGVCLSARYRSKFNLCEIYDISIDTTFKVAGVRVYTKVKVNGKSPCVDDKSCEKFFCFVHNIRSDYVQVFGNVYNIGSRIKVVCIATNVSEIIQCLPGGIWSKQYISCRAVHYSACEEPPSLHNGKIGTLSEFNKTHDILNVACDSGFHLLSYDNILCERSTGLWTGFESVCCENFHESGWTKVYKYKPTNSTYKIQGMYNRKHSLGVIDACKVGIYQNETFFINWKNEQTRYIKFTVYSNGDVVAHLLFNGLRTTNTSWFSIENLINSSWSDLKSDTTVQVFSIVGLRESYRRWYVAKQASEIASCSNDIAWLVVTWNFIYRCSAEEEENEMRMTKIMYAKNGKASTFNGDGFGLADKFEIWTKR